MSDIKIYKRSLNLRRGTRRDEDKGLMRYKTDLIYSNTLEEELIISYLYTDVLKYTSVDNLSGYEENKWSSFFDRDIAIILALISNTEISDARIEIEEIVIKIEISKSILSNSHEIGKIIKKAKELIILIDFWFDKLEEAETTWKLLNDFIYNFLISKLNLLKSYSDKLELSSLKKASISIELKDFFKSEIIERLRTKDIRGEEDKLRSDNDELNILDLIYKNLKYLVFNLLEIIDRVKISARNDFPSFIYTKNHNPQVGLLITFIRLLKEASSKINEIPYRYIKNYYKERLKFKNREATADRAIINFELNSKERIKLERGTKIACGKNTNGSTILFSLEDDVIVSSGEIVRMEILENYKSKREQSELTVEQSIITKYFEKKALDPSKPLGFASEIKGLETLGIMIASDVFEMEDGDRTVRINFHINQSDCDKIRNKYNAESSRYNFSTNSCIRNIILIEVTTTSGWKRLPNSMIKFYINDELENTLSISFSFSKNCLGIGMMMVEEIKKRIAAIKILINTDFYSDDVFLISQMKIEKISIDISIRDQTNLIVKNEFGVIDSTKSFFPFGLNPKVGSKFYIDCKRIINKNAQKFDLSLEWEEIPNNTRGFNGHYKNYSIPINNDSFKYSLSIMQKGRLKLLSDPKNLDNLFESKNRDPNGRIEEMKKITVKLVDNNNRKDVEEKAKIDLEDNICIELREPSIGFGYVDYTESMRKMIFKNAIEKNKNMETISMPYSPKIKSLSANYDLRYEISLNGDNLMENNKNASDIYMFQITSIGSKDIYPSSNIHDFKIAQPEDIVNNFFEKDSISITLEIVDFIETLLNIHIEIEENFIYDRAEEYSLIIEYVRNNRWCRVSKTNILKDSTNCLTKSGILSIELPNTTDRDDKLILRFIILTDTNNELPKIVGVYLNAGIMKRILKDNEIRIENKITKRTLEIQKPGIKCINQPFESFGFIEGESDEDLLSRANSRVQHKNRPQTVLSFERIVLDNFAEVFGVKCINHSSIKNFSTLSPGSISVLVIHKDFIKEGTIISERVLSDIKLFLESKCSSHINIEVSNPFFEELQVIADVSLINIEYGDFIKRINNELKNFITSKITKKLSNKNLTVATISPTEIYSLLTQKAEILEINNFHIIKSIETNDKKYLYKINYTDNIIEPKYPWSSLISAKEHIIYDRSREDIKNIDGYKVDIGISSSIISKNFIVGPLLEKDEEDIEEEEIEITKKSIAQNSFTFRF